MSDLASLLPGIAAIISAIGGVFVSVYAINRGSARERKQAARNAIERVLNPDDDEDDDTDRQDAIDAILKALEQKRKDDDR